MARRQALLLVVCLLAIALPARADSFDVLGELFALGGCVLLTIPTVLAAKGGDALAKRLPATPGRMVGKVVVGLINLGVVASWVSLELMLTREHLLDHTGVLGFIVQFWGLMSIGICGSIGIRLIWQAIATPPE